MTLDRGLLKFKVMKCVVCVQVIRSVLKSRDVVIMTPGNSRQNAYN